MTTILQLYRERGNDPAFWAEPINALTNASFVIAAACALHLAMDRQAMTSSTLLLIGLAAVIGVGSFLFHTAANRLTMWLDVIPIALFQTLFLWLATRDILSCSARLSLGIVLVIVCASFALMPVHKFLNGSLFYLPSLLAILTIGWMWSLRSSHEPYLLLLAAGCFALALTARTIDWSVPWPIGSHFLWHLLNGVVVYLTLRTWIVHTASRSM